MIYFRQILLTFIILLATAGYSLFLKLSATTALILVAEIDSSPGIFFDMIVKPYPIWIVIAWGLFFIQLYLMFKPFDEKTGIENVTGFWAFVHCMWIGAATVWHLAGMISPFISQSFIIN